MVHSPLSGFALLPRSGRVVCRPRAELLFLLRASPHTSLRPQLFSPLPGLAEKDPEWERVHEEDIERTSQVLGYNGGPLERSSGLGSHRWLSSWSSYVGPWMAGISLSGPWESGLQAAHSSRLQLLFCCHLTPLGPSPGLGRGGHHRLGIFPGRMRKGKGFKTLASSTPPMDPFTGQCESGAWNVPQGVRS